MAIQAQWTCGGVTFAVKDIRNAVIFYHCSRSRRTSGHDRAAIRAKFAGCLDRLTSMTPRKHIMTGDAGDYYTNPDDAPHIPDERRRKR